MIEALANLRDPLASHVLISVAALTLGIAVALPLTIWAGRDAAVARIALGVASLVQTIPALALLALFYPVLLWLSSLVGGGIPALGFLPALLALALYAVLPILRNGVTGLRDVDASVNEAADGVGMTAAQKLRWVELPLIAPVLMAGIRTAAVWTIGAATLSTTVGQPSLGDPIFAGLQTQNWTLVLAGCLGAAALALIVDGVLALIEHGIKWRRRAPIIAGLGVLVAGIALALTPIQAAKSDVVIIGAKNFSEQYILARLIGARLEAVGYTVRYKEGLGSAVIYRALASGDIDAYVEYSGTLWANEMKRSGAPPRDAMLHEINLWMKATGQARLVAPLGFENAYALAMKQADARALGIRSLDDLARAAPSLKLGADLEFLERPEWAAIRDTYRLNFASARAFTPTFMYRALESGTADVISAFSSDGRIAADELVVLSDPKRAIVRYDAVLLAGERRLSEPRFANALRPIANAITVDAMRRANYMVDRNNDKKDAKAGAIWLERAMSAPTPVEPNRD